MECGFGECLAASGRNSKTFSPIKEEKWLAGQRCVITVIVIIIYHLCHHHHTIWVNLMIGNLEKMKRLEYGRTGGGRPAATASSNAAWWSSYWSCWRSDWSWCQKVFHLCCPFSFLNGSLGFRLSLGVKIVIMMLLKLMMMMRLTSYRWWWQWWQCWRSYFTICLILTLESFVSLVLVGCFWLVLLKFCFYLLFSFMRWRLSLLFQTSSGSRSCCNQKYKGLS